jgi:hypothetical protein
MHGYALRSGLLAEKGGGHYIGVVTASGIADSRNLVDIYA